MSSNQRRLVLDVLQLIPDEYGRRYNALAALIPHLTSSRRDRAYDLVVSLGGGQASSALLRARLLAALSQRWDGEQRAQMLNQALETALSILASKDRAHTLVRLCEHLKDELRDRFIREGLDAAGEIVDPKERVHALAAIAAHLSGNSFTQAVQEGLDAAGEIADPKERAHALAAIAAHLSGNSFTQAVQEGLDAAGMVRDPKEQAYVLQALTPYLDRSSISHALKIANVPAAAGWRAFALAAVARRLAGEQQAQVFHEALGAVEAEPDDRQRGWLLAGLAPECTDPALLDRAMHLARAIPSPWPRIEALAALAPRFTGEARQSVLDLARHAVLTLPSDDWQAKYQAYAVELLAPVAHDDTLEHLLEIAIGIMETPWRAYALDALCPRLTAGLVKRSLEALARPSEPELALALAALMPYMPCDEQLKALESLEFALASSHAARRDTTGLLTKLASLLSGEPRTQVLRKAFAEALLVSHRWHPEDEALKALLPQLSDELLISGLEEVLTQTDVSILAAQTIISHLSSHFIGRASDVVHAVPADERVWLLIALANRADSNLKERLLREASTLALEIRQADKRARMLVRLASEADCDRRVKIVQEALEAISCITYPRSQLLQLALLFPYVKDDREEILLRQMLDQLPTAHPHPKVRGDRAYVLQTLARRWLDEPHYRSLLRAMELGMGLTYNKADYLYINSGLALVPHLTDGLLEALETALRIESRVSRTQALAAVVPQATDEMVRQGLESALAAGDEAHRTSNLKVLAPLIVEMGLLRRVLDLVQNAQSDY